MGKKYKNVDPAISDAIDREALKHDNPHKYYTMKVDCEEGSDDYLGEGKFSKVVKATCKTTGTVYAAKMIKYDKDSIKFAIREYDLMQQQLRLEPLNGHKHLVALHDAYIVRKYLILIIDLVVGKSILEFAHTKGSETSLNENDVAHLIRQLIEVLRDMHSKNIVHIDIRPTNIRLDKDSAFGLKLLDYNSCRHIPNKKAGLVVDVIGDTEFCAPELLSFEPVNPWSDMWSVGVITYILLSGISPFFYEDEEKVCKCVQNVTWQFDDAAFENVTPAAKDFIKKLFIRNANNRLSAEQALEHKWLNDEQYKQIRQNSVLDVAIELAATDARLLEEESEDYVFGSFVFKTYDEDEYESPEESDDEEEE